MDKNKLKSDIKKWVKVFFHYSLIIIGMLSCFIIGYYYRDLKTYMNRKPEVIKRSEVTLAIDEGSNFMIISKGNGTYIMLEDSIGRAIFDMYATSIWSKKTE